MVKNSSVSSILYNLYLTYFVSEVNFFFHQVMTVCRLHGLYDGIFYVYNNGLLDYVTPLEELLRELADAIEKKKPLSQRNVDLGNKILVYVSCCLAGRAFPHGDIPKERLIYVLLSYKL